MQLVRVEGSAGQDGYRTVSTSCAPSARSMYSFYYHARHVPEPKHPGTQIIRQVVLCRLEAPAPQLEKDFTSADGAL